MRSLFARLALVALLSAPAAALADPPHDLMDHLNFGDSDVPAHELDATMARLGVHAAPGDPTWNLPQNHPVFYPGRRVEIDVVRPSVGRAVPARGIVLRAYRAPGGRPEFIQVLHAVDRQPRIYRTSAQGGVVRPLRR